MKKRNLKLLQQIVYKATKKAGFDVHEEDVHIERTRTIEHGHFATNAAMLLAGKLGKKPREIAEDVVSNLDNELFEKVDIAGPGFINFYMKTEFYTQECQDIVGDLNKYLEESINEEEKSMIIDYSSPNIAKPLGVHHLLSTIIGDSIKKIYSKVGYKVVADNYLGDMGTQFGKLIYAIRNWSSIEEIEKDPINKLLDLYVKFHDEAEKNEELDQFARDEFKKFEEGDSDNRELWKKIVDWSLLEIKPLYERLDISFDEMRGESFYEDKMESILNLGRKKGVFVDGENGAWIVMPDDPNDPPAIVKKSDGSSIYLTRDLAQTDYWEKQYHPDLMVWVVDVAQTLHFRQRFNASRKLGHTTARMVHVDFGRMQFKDGGMSTRKGNIIRLSEVLDEAEKRAYDQAKDKGLDLNEEELRELARIMGIGATKYNILSQNRTTNITFDWNKMLSFEGNSIPYLMYTATRAKSVLKKAGVSNISGFKFVPETDSEHKVLIELMMYSDSIERSAEDFKPNHIANYLYQLAQDFNAFYNGNSIINAENEELKESRLLMTACTVRIMEDGLGLLGIEVPEKM